MSRMKQLPRCWLFHKRRILMMNEQRYVPVVVPYRLIKDLQLTEFGHTIHTTLVCTLSSTFPLKRLHFC
jgi:hypothetical protein